MLTRQTDRRALLAAIHAEAARIGMPEDARRELQKHLTGKKSCADMTLPELQRVAQRIRALGEAMPGGQKRYVLKRARPGRDERLPEADITLEQKHAIEHLFKDIETMAQGYVNPKWRIEFCTTTCGHFFPQTRAEANKVRQALEAMRRRKWHPTAEATP